MKVLVVALWLNICFDFYILFYLQLVIMNATDLQYRIREQAISNATSLNELTGWEADIRKKKSKLQASGPCV